MSPVFLDTVGIIASIDDTDQWHQAADVVYRQLLRSKRKLLTTSVVMLECGNAASRRIYRKDIVQLTRSLEATGLLIEPTGKEFWDAWDEYEEFSQHGPSIIDCISFQVMRRRGLTDVFSSDRHFATAGFTLLF
jgi:uncharacterized protein